MLKTTVLYCNNGDTTLYAGWLYSKKIIMWLFSLTSLNTQSARGHDVYLKIAME